jgi:hypothetical protein
MTTGPEIVVTPIGTNWSVTCPDGYRILVKNPDRSRPLAYRAKTVVHFEERHLRTATIDFLSLRDLESFALRLAALNGIPAVDWEDRLQQVYTKIHEQMVPEGDGPQAILLQADMVDEEALTYVWEPYIPRKMATLLDGDPGVGKTGLACLLASCITRGWPLPDQTGKPTLAPDSPGNVLMVAMEDHIGAVIIPRLKQCGADRSRITFVNEITDEEGNPRPFTLTDLPLLADYFARVHPQFVYIDAIQAVLGGKADINRANVVTALLAPLKTLAEQYDCAVLCSRHPAKPGQQVAKVLYRGMGSQAFVGTVRSGLFVEEHPSDETQSLLVHYKANARGLGRTMIFSKAHGHFEWVRASRVTHRALVGDMGPGPLPQQRMKAALWLESRLGPVGVPASQIFEEAENLYEYSKKVVRAAAECVGVTKTQVLSDFLWTLAPLTTTTPTTGVSGVSGISGVSGVSGVDLQILAETGVYSHSAQATQDTQDTPDHQDTPDTPSASLHTCARETSREADGALLYPLTGAEPMEEF